MKETNFKKEEISLIKEEDYLGNEMLSVLVGGSEPDKAEQEECTCDCWFGNSNKKH